MRPVAARSRELLKPRLRLPPIDGPVFTYHNPLDGQTAGWELAAAVYTRLPKKKWVLHGLLVFTNARAAIQFKVAHYRFFA